MFTLLSSVSMSCFCVCFLCMYKSFISCGGAYWNVSFGLEEKNALGIPDHDSRERYYMLQNVQYSCGLLLCCCDAVIAFFSFCLHFHSAFTREDIHIYYFSDYNLSNCDVLCVWSCFFKNLVFLIHFDFLSFFQHSTQSMPSCF